MLTTHLPDRFNAEGNVNVVVTPNTIDECGDVYTSTWPVGSHTLTVTPEHAVGTPAMFVNVPVTVGLSPISYVVISNPPIMQVLGLASQSQGMRLALPR